MPVIIITSINAKVPFKFSSDDTWLPVDSFIEKPISTEKLLKEVEKILFSKEKKNET